jgi:hypothetical protein
LAPENGGTQQVGRVSEFLGRIKTSITSFPCSLIVGILIGIVVVLITQGRGEFIAGIIIGLILEQIFLATRKIISKWISTRPLRILLSSFTTEEDCYIIFSSFQRDSQRPDEFKLARWNPERHGSEILVRGPSFVLGEGDAIALSLIRNLLAQLPKKSEQIVVERAEKYLDKWGINSFCIGPHNPRTQIILSKFEKKFFIFDNNYTVITKPDEPSSLHQSIGKQIKRGVFFESNGFEPTDYGILLKLKDQFKQNRSTIFVVAGIGPAGTSGAAFYLLSNYRQLASLGEEFGLLIQVPSGYQSARKVEFDKVANYYVIE